MDMHEPQQFRITAQLLLSILGGELYASHDYSLWEIVRNAVCACMPNTKQWVAGAGDVEIFLRKHPFAAGAMCLIVLDHGRGFTADGFERFFTLGASVEDLLQNPEGMHGGASQKRIGRFAALALNSRCFKDKDGSSGFAVFTRRAARGDVCSIPVIPLDVERTQRITPSTLAPDAAELGFLKGIKGSFTAFVIANPVFSSYTEIRDALRWRVPRRKDQMFKLSIGEEIFTPPALASEFSDVSPDGTIEMHLERASKDDMEPGVWFTDCATGLRVACARDMSASHVPYPFYSPDLSGDIFVPGLLAKQSTSRSGLSPAYLRSPAWLRVTRYLTTQAERVRGLLGENEPRPKSPARSAMAGLAEICNRMFGPPERLGGNEMEIDRKDGPPPDHSPKKEPVVREGKDSKEPKHAEETAREKNQRKRAAQCIRIGDNTYRIVNVQADPLSLVTVGSGTIYLNEAYGLIPSRRDAREEHVWNAVLMAVAHSEKPDSPLIDIVRKVSEWRLLLFKKG